MRRSRKAAQGDARCVLGVDSEASWFTSQSRSWRGEPGGLGRAVCQIAQGDEAEEDGGDAFQDEHPAPVEGVEDQRGEWAAEDL